MFYPLITIGLPAYNAENTIGLTIHSLILQTYDNWELLIFDDGSTDSTVNEAKKFKDSRIYILSDGQNKGISSRLNQAISIGKGKYFCRMDADDIAFPSRIEKQVAFLETHSIIDIVATSVVVFSDNGCLEGIIKVHANHDLICRHPWRGFYFPHPSWMGKIEWFKCHPYTSVADGAEDQLLIYNSFRDSHFAGIKDVLLAYRESNRIFKKMLIRRKIFWKMISISAIKNKHLIDFFMLSITLPLKIMADFINIKFGIKAMRNKTIKVDSLLQSRWHYLHGYLHKYNKKNQVDF